MPCLLLINILKRMYKNVLVIGSEVHSTGLDMTSRGRGVSVILEMEQEQPF
jgi:3-oxoacyl-[acyl-carrier-protein] synthase-3